MLVRPAPRPKVVIFAGHSGKTTKRDVYEGNGDGHADHYLDEELGKDSELFDGRTALSHSVETWDGAGARVIVLGPDRLRDDLKSVRDRHEHIEDKEDLEGLDGKISFTGVIAEDAPGQLLTVATNDAMPGRYAGLYLQDLEHYARQGMRHVSPMVDARAIVREGCGFRPKLRHKRFYRVRRDGHREIVAFPNVVSYIPGEVDLEKAAGMATLFFPNREKGTKSEIFKEVWNDVKDDPAQRAFFFQTLREALPLITSMVRSKFGDYFPTFMLPAVFGVTSQMRPLFKTVAPHRHVAPTTLYVPFAMDFDGRDEAIAVASYHRMTLTHR